MTEETDYAAIYSAVNATQRDAALTAKAALEEALVVIAAQNARLVETGNKSPIKIQLEAILATNTNQAFSLESLAEAITPPQ